jgi:DNA-3-methyladenine glycosylase
MVAMGPQAMSVPCDGVPLPRSFFARPARIVARELLGTVLVHRRVDAVLCARIVETEAYVGTHDLASHAAKGRTRRNNAMFGPAGHAYVYFVYGMHHMLNVVAAEAGDPQAVLLRAAEPIAGIAQLTNGPGRLARAFGITRDFDGEDLCGRRLYLMAGVEPRRIVASARIGVDYAGPWAGEPLRFCDADSQHLSRRA